MVSAMTDGSTTITLNESERRSLEGLVANRNTPAKVVWRGKNSSTASPRGGTAMAPTQYARAKSMLPSRRCSIRRSGDGNSLRRGSENWPARGWAA